MSYCSGCGWKRKESSVFCGGCGQNFEAAVAEGGVEKSAGLEGAVEEVQQAEENDVEVDVVEESSALSQERAALKAEETGNQEDATAGKKSSKKVWVIAAAAVLVFAMVAGVVVVQQHNERERVRIEAEEAELARIVAEEMEEARTRFDEIAEIADGVNNFINGVIVRADYLLEGEPNVGDDRSSVEALKAVVDELDSLKITVPPLPYAIEEIHLAASSMEADINLANEGLVERYRNLGPGFSLIDIVDSGRLAYLIDDFYAALDRVHDAIDAEEAAEAERQAEAERRAAEEAQRQGVERLRRGDISHLAGTWVNGYGFTFTISDDGIIDRGDGIRNRISFGCTGENWICGRNALIDSRGRYLDASEGSVCVNAIFFPAGVDTVGVLYDAATFGRTPLESDTSRERLWFGQCIGGSTADALYYRR